MLFQAKQRRDRVPTSLEHNFEEARRQAIVPYLADSSTAQGGQHALVPALNPRWVVRSILQVLLHALPPPEGRHVCPVLGFWVKRSGNGHIEQRQSAHQSKDALQTRSSAHHRVRNPVQL